MYKGLFVLILFQGIKQSCQQYDFNLYRNIFNTPERILQMMQASYEGNGARIKKLNYERDEFQDSPFFEMGWLLSEIIERYRKMVALNKRCTLYRSISVFEALKKTSLIQKLYFEIYHLTMMFHEIERKHMEKYAAHFEMLKNDFYSLNQHDVKQLKAMKKLAHENSLKAMHERQKRLQMLKDIQEKYVAGLIATDPHKDSTRWWWPVDYGWEVDEYW